MIKRYTQRPTLHAGVTHNGVLYAAGHAASDLNQDIAGQTREICGKLDDLLSEVGSDKTRILHARIYLSEMSNKSEMNKVWVDWLKPEQMPSRATIGGADLGDPNRLIEVVITAAVD